MASTSHASIGVAIPSNGLWQADFGSNLAQLAGYVGAVQLPGYKETSLKIASCEGSNLPSNRFHLLKTCIKNGCTHILCLDSDMTFPRDTLHRLISHDKEFVAANCVTRKGRCMPTATGFDLQKVHSWGKSGLEKVMQVGLAVMLIKVEALKDLRPPLFNFNWVDDYQDHCGEDVYFCHLVQEMTDYEFWIDHDLSNEVGHIGRVTYTQEFAHAQMVKNQNVA